MSFQSKFATVLSSDCLSFSVIDLTGIYNSVSNPTGIGTPNPAIGDFTGATLTVVLSDGSTKVFGDGTFYPLFPNTSGVRFTITNVMLGLDEDTAITDFISLITYAASTEEDDYSTAMYFPIVCQAECCVNNLLAQVDWNANCEPCKNQNLQKWIKGYGMLKSIYADLACDPQLPNNAAATLTTLTDFCHAAGCGVCS